MFGLMKGKLSAATPVFIFCLVAKPQTQFREIVECLFGRRPLPPANRLGTSLNSQVGHASSTLWTIIMLVVS